MVQEKWISNYRGLLHFKALLWEYDRRTLLHIDERKKD